jgi:hypothetical protein
VQLALGASPLLRGLPLQDPERPKIALGLDDPLDRGGPERPDQLVFQVGDLTQE